MNQPYEFIVVDDDAISNMISQLTIRRTWKDAPVHLFTEPEKALAYIEGSGADGGLYIAMFLDINMPTLTGWEFLDELSKMPVLAKNTFKIFILSSSIDDRDRQRALSNPLVSGFLSKPLTTSAISNLLD